MDQSRRYTSPIIAEFPYELVRVACTRCDRRGQYRRDTLIATYGADVVTPDLLHLIAKCERHGKLGDACGVYYADLLPVAKK